MLNLKGLMLVMFGRDTMVYPKESELFGQMDLDGEVCLFNEEAHSYYAEDPIGLKSLDYDGKVEYILIDDDHLQFSDQWISRVFRPFLQGRSIKLSDKAFETVMHEEKVYTDL